MGKLKVFSVALYRRICQLLYSITLCVCTIIVLFMCPYVCLFFVWVGYICPVALTLGQSLKFSDFHAYIHTMSRIAASSL